MNAQKKTVVDPFPRLNADVKNNAPALAIFKNIVDRLSIQFNAIPGDPVDTFLIEGRRKFFARIFGAQCYLAVCDGDKRTVKEIINLLYAGKSHLL